MMSRKTRRSPLEQIVDLLNACREEKTITNLLYATNMNTILLHKALDKLIAKGLAYKKDGKYPLYGVTEKGIEWLNIYQKFLDFET
jgi:predicted transcriptional regulator